MFLSALIIISLKFSVNNCLCFNVYVLQLTFSCIFLNIFFLKHNEKDRITYKISLTSSEIPLIISFATKKYKRMWRNGRRTRLKILREQSRVGSSPTIRIPLKKLFGYTKELFPFSLFFCHFLAFCNQFPANIKAVKCGKIVCRRLRSADHLNRSVLF